MLQNAYNPLVLQQSAMNKVYSWMTAGLFLTGGIAWWISSTDFALFLFKNPLILIFVFMGQIGLVASISAGINKMSFSVAIWLFLAYAILNGLTFSWIFILYTPVSIATTFLITAGTFMAISFYGYTTRRNLNPLGNFLVFSLFGLIIASVINLFWQNSALYWLVTFAGILIFAGLTAWETVKIKDALAQAGNQDTVNRIALLGALSLYINFINIFIYMLRIFGNRDD